MDQQQVRPYNNIYDTSGVQVLILQTGAESMANTDEGNIDLTVSRALLLCDILSISMNGHKFHAAYKHSGMNLG